MEAAPEEAVENTLFDLGEPAAAPEAPAAPAAEEPRPQARPAPVATRDAFIPPSPVQVAENRDFGEDLADPFAEADYANAGHEQAQQKAPKRSNLFRRMTGLVSGRENLNKPEKCCADPGRARPWCDAGTGRKTGAKQRR